MCVCVWLCGYVEESSNSLVLPLVFLSDSSIKMNTWNPNTPLSLKLELAPRPEKGRLASPMKTLDFSTDQCCHIIVVNSCEVHRFSGTDGMMRMICQGTCSLSCTSWKAYEPKEKNGCYMLIGRNLVSIIWYHLVSSGIIWYHLVSSGHDFEDVPPHDVLIKYITLAVDCNLSNNLWREDTWPYTVWCPPN